MTPRRRRLLALLLLPALLLLAVPRAEAQQNPFLGGQGDGGSASAESAAPARPGPLHRLQAFIIATQRDVNREINHSLVAIRDGQGAGVVLAGLVIAFLYGVFHALGPGHGKTVIVGYFLGRGGSIPRGIGMASWIALSHVVGAMAVVGILHLILSFSLVTPVEEMLSLRLVSYGAILLIGLVMLAATVRRHGRGSGAPCHHHGHGHHHSHDHAHGHGQVPRPGGGSREQHLLALAAGFLPCSGAVLILVFAFAKLKTLLRKAEARTVEAVRAAIAQLLQSFKPDECANYFKNAGYAAST